MTIGLKRGTVELYEHQTEWSQEAKRCMEELKSLLGCVVVDVEHIGSTAISSICAKPIIDIVVGVRRLEDIMPYIDQLEENHYIFKREDVSGQLLFVKGDFSKDTRTHHIHVVVYDGNAWNRYLDFRDYLNAFPEKAKLYHDWKKNLALQYSDQRKEYTKAKQEIIEVLCREARSWRVHKK